MYRCSRQVARENGFVASPQSASMSMVDLIQAAAAEKELEGKREAYRERRRATRHQREESKEAFPTMVERRVSVAHGAASHDDGRPKEIIDDDAEQAQETKQSVSSLLEPKLTGDDGRPTESESVGRGARDEGVGVGAGGVANRNKFEKSSAQISRARAASRGSPRRRKSTVGAAAGAGLARQQRKNILDKLRDNPVVMDKLRSSSPDNTPDTPVLPAATTSTIADDHDDHDDDAINGAGIAVADTTTPSQVAPLDDDDGPTEASLEIALPGAEAQETRHTPKEEGEGEEEEKEEDSEEASARRRRSAQARHPTPVSLEEAIRYTAFSALSKLQHLLCCDGDL